VITAKGVGWFPQNRGIDRAAHSNVALDDESAQITLLTRAFQAEYSLNFAINCW